MEKLSLGTKTKEELTAMLHESRHELTKLRFQVSERQLKQVHRIAVIRRTIARVQTALGKLR